MKTFALLLAGALTFSPAAGFAQGPTDAQIAHIVVTANQVDIDAGGHPSRGVARRQPAGEGPRPFV